MAPIQVKVAAIENLDKVQASVFQKSTDPYDGFVHVYFVKPKDLLVIKVWDGDAKPRFYKNEEQFGLSVDKATVEELRTLAGAQKKNVGQIVLLSDAAAAAEIVQRVMKIASIDIKKRIVNKTIKYPFYVENDMEEKDFKQLFLEAFPLLEANKNAAPFIPGLVKIGSFMTWKEKVRKALEPLSKSIDAAVRKQVADYEAGHRKGDWGGENRHGEKVLFKTHKLLSNALLVEENHHGFNNQVPFKHEGAGVELASYTQVGAAQHAVGGQFKVADAKSWKEGGVSAPKGVPALSGVLAGAFNRVLLRHGFHWKDPGAGIAHGEYTHRYQWNAVFNSGITGFGKSYLEIFRCMGNLWARHAIDAYDDGSALSPGEGGKGYYIWQMIFDATWRHMVTGAKVGEENPEDQWKPRSDNYTCPEVMNKDLGADGKWPDDKDPLYALMVMNHVRWKKRGYVENLSRVATPHNPIKRFEAPGSLGSAMPQGGTHKASVVMLDKSSEQNNYIIWYVTEDDGKRKLFSS